jgi:1,4-alpha-glucan branching enzyme
MLDVPGDAGVPLQAVEALVTGRHGDPFAILGPHTTPDGDCVRAFLPGATAVEVLPATQDEPASAATCVHPAGLFVAPLRHRAYRLRIAWPDASEVTEDPYAFGLLLPDDDLQHIAAGTHRDLAGCLGARPMRHEGVHGIRFTVWAPNARRASVVGDFNRWDDRRHAMRLRHRAGVWEIFVPRLLPGALYKFAMLGPDGAPLAWKADPMAQACEIAPRTASIVVQHGFRWSDDDWMAARAARQAPDAPISVYEVHATSWLRHPNQSWDSIADRLVPYVADMGFTHLELLPPTHHPFAGSWGYQPLALFAPMPALGPPEGLARLVDRCHRAGIGVLLDWVPGHFPSDDHGLARFDGTALYEHQDPREGFHRDWNTLIYNHGRSEVRGFLIASALYWLERYHADGLRVDAVASMLYRDYSRAAGEWVPNRFGGRENLEAVDFLRAANETVRERCPGAITVAEESTAWPRVTARTHEGGLGFTYKWNMGWMHDTLEYMQREPVHRRYHHGEITFGLAYAFSERFVLPLSHDEVVHGKRSLLGRMPGNDWERFANLRTYLGFMWAHPGKKLLFMGGELAAPTEWDHDGSLDWNLLDHPAHRGVQQLVRDLNCTYRSERALHARDTEVAGFRWIVGNDEAQSIFAFLRLGDDGDPPVLAVVNMTPIARHGYRVGVPAGGLWREILNTDAAIYGGSNLGNAGMVVADPVGSHGEPASLVLTLPPLAALYLRRE